MRTIPVRFLRSATSTATLRGVDLQEWMDQLGMDPALLFDDRSRITVEQAASLVRAVWKLTGDEMAGLGPGPAPSGTFRMICLGVISSVDLGTALGRFQEFTRILPSMPTFTIETGPESSRVVYAIDAENDPTGFITDLMMSVSVRFFSWLAGTRLPIEAIELPHPLPEDAEHYDLVFGSHVTFGRPEPAIVFANEMLTLPVVQDEASLERWLRDAPADLLMLREYGTTVADQVRSILERGLRGDWPSPDEVAARLSMSTQNMRRLLREEGTSVTRIKEELLRDAAVTALVRGEETVAELAARLGFSEPSAFHRAFRRWTGSAPGAYRPRASAQPADPGTR